MLQREKFIQLIGREIRLEHVDIAHWAGLGGVRYIPSDFVDQIEKEEQEQEVDAVREYANLDSILHLHTFGYQLVIA